MERTQIYLAAEQKARLEAIARAKSVPMADVVRDAVAQYLLASEPDQLLTVIKETFGAVVEWKEKDGVALQRELRSMWEDSKHGKQQG
ncbi:MAG: CopG family transcriptional regulator [Bacillota bacterium]